MSLKQYSFLPINLANIRHINTSACWRKRTLSTSLAGGETGTAFQKDNLLLILNTPEEEQLPLHFPSDRLPISAAHGCPARGPGKRSLLRDASWANAQANGQETCNSPSVKSPIHLSAMWKIHENYIPGCPTGFIPMVAYFLFTAPYKQAVTA